MINRINFFDQPVKIDLRTYDNLERLQLVKEMITKFLVYPYFKKCHKLIAIVLSKQQVVGDDPKAIQQINFTGNLDRDGTTTIYFIIEEAKETVLNVSKETMRVILFCFNIISNVNINFNII